ncbi:MAG: hypothetical protein NW226_12385 [Microscillaceae bacterium]|nr:hypothetical protein [Microscillaceae bacterium]
MKSIQFPILFTTGFVYMYTILLLFNTSYVLILLLFSLSHFLIIWMVLHILKDGIGSEKKFSEGYLYEDVNYPITRKED